MASPPPETTLKNRDSSVFSSTSWLDDPWVPLDSEMKRIVLQKRAPPFFFPSFSFFPFSRSLVLTFLFISLEIPSLSRSFLASDCPSNITKQQQQPIFLFFSFSLFSSVLGETTPASNPSSPYPLLLIPDPDITNPFDKSFPDSLGPDSLLSTSPFQATYRPRFFLDGVLPPAPIHQQIQAQAQAQAQLQAPPLVKLNHGSLAEFLGGSIPGSPASFLHASTTSEAQGGDSGDREPSILKDESLVPEDNAAGSSLDAAGRKKVRREVGHPLTEEEKRQRFLERNRRAAQRCRQKKKDMIEKLQRKANELEQGYCQLVKQVEATKVLNGYMMTLIGDHKGCQRFNLSRPL